MEKYKKLKKYLENFDIDLDSALESNFIYNIKNLKEIKNPEEFGKYLNEKHKNKWSLLLKLDEVRKINEENYFMAIVYDEDVNDYVWTYYTPNKAATFYLPIAKNIFNETEFKEIEEILKGGENERHWRANMNELSKTITLMNKCYRKGEALREIILNLFLYFGLQVDKSRIENTLEPQQIELIDIEEVRKLMRDLDAISESYFLDRFNKIKEEEPSNIYVKKLEKAFADLNK
ncbi:hypothetical protein [Mesomycoplasma lagogenitalium]|uniref:Uncharacterized protein n=1 Tax=Mesomycoplasma lagogenitalium TaxID=171286 RepID=A0ABY8LT89_9BACT|nr:hypothetical protein [Mesomycoplasma lagogenitalium]WGI36459.1 hypothetical protein QEG99_03270 [Mesomycoplasma lagogenitalium]